MLSNFVTIEQVYYLAHIVSVVNTLSMVQLIISYYAILLFNLPAHSHHFSILAGWYNTHACTFKVTSPRMLHYMNGTDVSS